ncbi:MAG: sulfatase-like hydrolase/transferase [Chitinophagales bacterium]
MLLKSFCILFFFFVSAGIAFTQPADKPNFIFIVLDDLNDYVEGFTDQPQVLTPNLKALSEEGMVFTNAFVNAPGCGPSRTSFLSGKDVQYTQVFNNDDYESKFRDNFTAVENNEEVFTFPQVLKDSGGYYTYAINKIFHNPNENDFDKIVGTPECEKTLSWNRMEFSGDSDSLLEAFSAYGFGNFFDWGKIPDSLEYKMEDYIAADTAINFINNYGMGIDNTCGNPFFLALGFARPHSERYIPEKYFPEYYLENIYDEPYIIPYNFPVGNYPYNGIVMPVQPDILYGDYYALPPTGVAVSLAEMGNVYDQVTNYISSLPSLPEIDAVLTDADREIIIRESVFANYQINYIAAVQFIDAQVGRVIDALDSFPELKENTIIVVISDNGYSLGEKKHWTKWSLWDTDLRVPMIIIDPSKPGNRVCKQSVSMLDLFPTFCDMAGVNYPVFEDGSQYLDGNSFINLLDEPALKYEYPAISTSKKASSIGSCFSHISLRDQRFHYIRYRENNDGGVATSICDSTTFIFEKELYEVGVDRETDPNEWNNLAGDEDYAPLMHFFDQWMPDSLLYLQKTFKAYIQTNTLNCFVNHDDTLLLSFTLYDTSGTLISPPGDYTYKWTNNLTGDILYGAETEFPMQLIPDAAFDANEKFMVYLEMINAANTITAAFDLKYFYINDENIPEATFNLINETGLTVCILDHVITGTYTDAWWDFGDGTISYEDMPGPYDYAATGTYTVTNFVEYGNDSCVGAFTQTITLDNSNPNPEYDVKYFPNPVSEELFISLPDMIDFASVTIYDITGREINSNRYMSGTCNFACSVDVSGLNPGVYIFELRTEEASYAAPFIISH